MRAEYRLERKRVKIPDSGGDDVSDSKRANAVSISEVEVAGRVQISAGVDRRRVKSGVG